MKKICLLLIFLQSTPRGTTQAHDPVVVVSYPRSGIVKEGDNFSLQCLHSKKYISWYKDRKQLHGFSNEFYESRADSRSGGSYQCETWLNEWRKSKSLEVVTTAHEKILTLEVKPRAALRGESISLKYLVSPRVGVRSKVFQWYRNKTLIRQIDESEYTIENAQDSDEASYRCEIKKRYRKWVSPEVDVTVTVQSHTTAITASVLPLLLIAVLIALVFFKLRNKKQENSSSVSRPQGEGTGIGAQSLSEETPAANSEYAVVGSARNTAPEADELTYCVVQGTKPREDYNKPAADVVYSEVMMKKSGDAGKDDGVSGGKQKKKTDPDDYSITYATLNHANTEVSLEGDQREEENDRDANIYENLQRK
ncbi:uncharacterized protein [Heptranchias perlo]|uniref:uncharacterized protein n=1 Tax=Heptranchias perlo TaxID=212740 RepID=UPI003559CD89